MIQRTGSMEVGTVEKSSLGQGPIARLTPSAESGITTSIIQDIYQQFQHKYQPAYLEHSSTPQSSLAPMSSLSSSSARWNPNYPPRNPTTTHLPISGSTPSLIYVLLPILIILSTLLLLLLVFLVAIIWVKRRQGIRLVEEGGPLDLSRGDGGIVGEGGLSGVESRWLEGVSEDVREGYRRAQDYQLQYPPASAPTDITLSQFLSIQEKGVSAWCFEPDYESVPSLFVESRTEITFLQDGPGMSAREGGGNTVLANLPIPKLNEVYYWEAKFYDKPEGTEVAIGLATKPYPNFRLPGWNKVSVGYFSSDGFKGHNYPFTAASHGPPLKEGDVLGVGYRPRQGTVFFTKNGRKLDDCYTGLATHNLFPAIGANGACSIHVNLGQSGFVFIEANVRKWGLAPMTGTLAPPPAYGSERGSILLDAGYGAPGAGSLRSESALGSLRAESFLEGAGGGAGSMPSTPSYHRAMRPSSFGAQTGGQHRRRESGGAFSTSVPVRSSPLRVTGVSSSGEGATAGPSISSRRLGRDSASANMVNSSDRYYSPTDQPDLPIARRFPTPVAEDDDDPADDADVDGEDRYSDGEDSASSGDMYSGAEGEGEGDSEIHSPANPPTPHMMDISMHTLHDHQVDHPNYFGGRASGEPSGSGSGSNERGSAESSDTVRDERDHTHTYYADETRRQRRAREQGDRQSRELYARRLRGVVEGDHPPPGYAPLDPNVYSDGVPTDLPAELISQAFENASLAEQSRPRRSQTHSRQQSQAQSQSSTWSLNRFLTTAMDTLQGVTPAAGRR